MKIAYVGNYKLSFCTEVHIAKTLESLGHQVQRIQEDSLTPGDLPRLIAPGTDLVLWTRTWRGHVSLEDLEILRHVNAIPTASYHLDLYVGLQREDGLDTDPFWRTDYVFTPDGSPEAAAVFAAKGVRHHYIKPAVFKDECVPGNFRPELAKDVVFVGGGATYAHPEWPYRRQLVQWLRDTYGDRFGKYGHPERVMRGQDLNDLYASAKVVVGDSLCIDFKKTYYWSDRVYETIGRGGFMIHPDISGMGEEFDDGNTIVFYKFGDFDGLKAKIDYYLAHEDERERIRKAGQEWVGEVATYDVRLRHALNIVFPPQAKNSQGRIVINLGAGSEARLHPEFINVDFIAAPGVDVVHNVMEFPWPFEDASADEIRATDLVEHLPVTTRHYEPTYIKFVEEAHRVLKPGGLLLIQTPHWQSKNLYIDPTHVRGFDERSFDYFDQRTDLGLDYGYYSDKKFSVGAVRTPNDNVIFNMVKL